MNQVVPQRSWLWRFLQILARVLTTLLFDLKVRGTENVPSRGGALLLANHQSFLDPVIVAVRLNRPVSFMAKSELFEGNGFFAWLIRSLHAFPIRQASADVGAIKQAVTRLQEGNILNIYPEGSRSYDGEIGPMQPGVALIVRRAGVPIVPVVIDGTYKAWRRGTGMFRSHPVRVLYGPPLHVNGLKSNEILDLIDKTLRRMLIELREGKW